MILVVSDTSAIRALAHLDCLRLLPTLFDKVVVPQSVNKELLNPPASFQPVNVAESDFIDVQVPSSIEGVKSLQRSLDTGEAEAIVLAEELSAKWLLIDEKAGRAVAQQRGLSVVGTLGILLRMKDQGEIQSIAPRLDMLQCELGFFLSFALPTSTRLKAGWRSRTLRRQLRKARARLNNGRFSCWLQTSTIPSNYEPSCLEWSSTKRSRSSKPSPKRRRTEPCTINVKKPFATINGWWRAHAKKASKKDEKKG